MPNPSPLAREAEVYDNLEVFEIRLKSFMKEMTEFLLSKNKSYGDSAMHPVRIFSTALPEEQVRVRIDDKLSRLSRGIGLDDEDVTKDLIGYLIILRMHQEDQKSGEEVAKAINDEYKQTIIVQNFNESVEHLDR